MVLMLIMVSTVPREQNESEAARRVDSIDRTDCWTYSSCMGRIQSAKGTTRPNTGMNGRINDLLLKGRASIVPGKELIVVNRVLSRGPSSKTLLMMSSCRFVRCCHAEWFIRTKNFCSLREIFKNEPSNPFARRSSLSLQSRCVTLSVAFWDTPRYSRYSCKVSGPNGLFCVR